MSRNVQIAVRVSLFIILALIVTACGSGALKQPDQISVRLKWLHQSQFAGFYVAEQEGYYDEENLDVTLEPIDIDHQITNEYVLSGENDFALGAPEELIIARSEGKKVRAVTAIFQIAPLVYMTPEETGISKPADFTNQTVALSPGQGTYLYEAMLGHLGVDRSQINETKMTSWDLLECWESADVCTGYAINDLPYVEREGRPANAIWPADYGALFYGDVLFTTDEFIEKNPDVVERFVRATLKGWQKAIEDPDLAAKATLAFDSELDYDLQLDSMKASIPLIDTGANPIGWMESDLWQNMHDILLEQGLINEAIDVSPVYTNEFVEDAQ
jgi:NitT/TauT family transport system substrate-binding protein